MVQCYKPSSKCVSLLQHQMAAGAIDWTQGIKILPLDRALIRDGSRLFHPQRCDSSLHIDSTHFHRELGSHVSCHEWSSKRVLIIQPRAGTCIFVQNLPKGL